MGFKYLKVSFYDNDFGWYVERALRRLWDFLKENNAHPLGGSTSDAFMELFIGLNKAGALHSLLERLYVLAYLEGDVELSTRGLYRMGDDRDVDYSKAIIKDAGKVQYENECLWLDIEFRKIGRFIKKWCNGECAYLNLQTGETGTF